ncbi:diacylglycerol kinase family protein [Dysgonomonas sp. GY617]|uniref:diacylglycerol kinase family protein n=1 Tax=Dysgonomonas sp. GY617 TaxID=2780420 RepID=UPI0018844C5B|nr:diacylglycerol kinase family protein [Dysgonomonas sp. GY617]MBF0576315.1 diacylglycerol kinase family protein [Dysgonomonas sp. GY617]
MNNKSNEKFSLSKRLRSFSYAFNGLRTVVKEEHNARIHLIVSSIVIVCGFIFQISIIEWIILCFAIGFVISIEILNSAIENLADFVSPEYHNLIKKVKDISAAAVLVSTISSVVIGILIFLPKIILLVNN